MVKTVFLLPFSLLLLLGCKQEETRDAQALNGQHPVNVRYRYIPAGNNGTAVDSAYDDVMTIAGTSDTIVVDLLKTGEHRLAYEGTHGDTLKYTQPYPGLPNAYTLYFVAATSTIIYEETAQTWHQGNTVLSAVSY